MAGVTSGPGLDYGGTAHQRFRLGSDRAFPSEVTGSRSVRDASSLDLAQIAHQKRKEFSSSRPIALRSSPGRSMDRLTSMTAFVAVAQSASFTVAAKRLDISTSMASTHIQALEQRLNVRLLNRTTRRVSLTDKGRVFYNRCLQILGDIERAEDLTVSYQSPPLRIYADSHLSFFVAPILVDYLSNFPNSRVDFRTEERAIGSDHDNFDVKIRCGPSEGLDPTACHIAAWRYTLCAAPSYLHRTGVPVHPAELVNHNCVRRVDCHLQDHWVFKGPSKGSSTVRISGNLTLDNNEALIQAALTGIGIVLAPELLVNRELTAGRLIHVLPEYKPSELSLSAVYSKRRFTEARAFVDLLIQGGARGASPPR